MAVLESTQLLQDSKKSVSDVEDISSSSEINEENIQCKEV